MASGEETTPGGTSRTDSRGNSALTAVQRLMDETVVQLALQPITTELRSLMGQLQASTSPATVSNVDGLLIREVLNFSSCGVCKGSATRTK